MGLFKKNKNVGLISDIIRCDEPEYLIWKWHPDGKEPGEHIREYSIRSGSHLRVKDGEVAVFVYKQKDGKMQDFIEGPFDQKLKTANLPVLTSFLGAFVGGDTPFQAEVYFINLANIIQTKFAVPYFDVCDPRYPDFSVPVAVRGTISFKIKDYREFIKLHRLVGFDLDDFKDQISDAVSRYVKNTVANIPVSHGIPIVQIQAKTEVINNTVELGIKTRLEDSFGVTVSGVDIGDIDVDKDSDAYRELARITKGATAATVQGQTAYNIEHYGDSLRRGREEAQYALHKQTQTANIGAYQIEKQAEVGVAGAEALGKMGSNNAGHVNLGGGRGVGFNPAAMMASMTVGSTVAKSMASVMNNAMNAGDTDVPPPIPKTVYNVAKDGKPTGPFDLEKLAEMATSGELTPDSLVWKKGMASWKKAGEVKELKDIFPPPIV